MLYIYSQKKDNAYAYEVEVEVPLLYHSICSRVTTVVFINCHVSAVNLS